MKQLAVKHPVLTFLLITFGWSWIFWLFAILFRGQSLLVMAMVMLGGFGPALGGIVTLGLKSNSRFEFSPKRIFTMIIVSLLIFGLMVTRYKVGNIPNYETLADNLVLTPAIILFTVLTSLLGGWIFSSAVSRNTKIRSRMSSILPVNLPIGWTILAFVFYPLMILAAWGLSSLLGIGVEYPGLWGQSILDVLPIYLLSFGLTALAQGGNEEPGWRGYMQPELQKNFSPLIAAIIVSVFWSLWHLPLYLNGFYPGDLVGGMVGGAIFRVLLAIFLAWFYNRTKGNLFLMIILHTSFNWMVNFLPTSDIGLLVLWLIVVVVVVLKDKMYKKIVWKNDKQL
jgi:membrane protease YdiL (CAAX protease family)